MLTFRDRNSAGWSGCKVSMLTLRDRNNPGCSGCNGFKVSI